VSARRTRTGKCDGFKCPRHSTRAPSQAGLPEIWQVSRSDTSFDWMQCSCATPGNGRAGELPTSWRTRRGTIDITIFCFITALAARRARMCLGHYTYIPGNVVEIIIRWLTSVQVCLSLSSFRRTRGGAINTIFRFITALAARRARMCLGHHTCIPGNAVELVRISIRRLTSFIVFISIRSMDKYLSSNFNLPSRKLDVLTYLSISF
jgi:hypothetical protein